MIGLRAHRAGPAALSVGVDQRGRPSSSYFDPVLTSTGVYGERSDDAEAEIDRSRRTMKSARQTMALFGGGALMVLCCAVGPAAIGAAAGSAVGGWVGIACAVLVAAAVAVLVSRRAGKRGGC